MVVYQVLCAKFALEEAGASTGSSLLLLTTVVLAVEVCATTIHDEDLTATFVNASGH
jgi:hypothetical protein